MEDGKALELWLNHLHVGGVGVGETPTIYLLHVLVSNRKKGSYAIYSLVIVILASSRVYSHSV